MQASDIYLHHVLRTTLMNLDILEQQMVINPSETSSVRSTLQARLGVAGSQSQHQQHQQGLVPYGVGAGPVQGQGQGGLPLAPPSLPPRQLSGQAVHADPSAGLDRAVAEWDYAGTAPDDLNFRKGEVIVIDREANAEWFHGHVLDDPSRSGLFPHNYVRRLPPGSSSPMPPPHQPMSTPDYNEKASFAHGPPQMPMYAQPPPGSGPGQWQPGPPPPQQMMYANAPPPQHPQQVFPYNPPAPPQAQPQAQPPAAPEKKPNRFGKVGGQLGNAFVNGAGFGAGAAIGGDIVHAIF